LVSRTIVVGYTVLEVVVLFTPATVTVYDGVTVVVPFTDASTSGWYEPLPWPYAKSTADWLVNTRWLAFPERKVIPETDAGTTPTATMTARRAT
jgi:hypothetical protein